MDSVNVSKEELLETLYKNRNTHVQEYQEAHEGYLRHVRGHLDRLCAVLTSAIQDGTDVPKEVRQGTISFDPPMCYRSAYDQAIRMAEMSVDSTVKLSAKNFKNYVLDEWSWKTGFLHTNSNYKR